ncbi:MAG: hypothetical protein Satyrvirus27_18 [Satyrvirus sp.]|uniref:Uncharacterized protein n=1 Tax=Satyrvirus sp. TaxID=2487771 RepID=A0A3G5AH63_9VIRU|nr:MAG: hypothetical protein Satyrvirus27_18 [Satyrvirus sp.]
MVPGSPDGIVGKYHFVKALPDLPDPFHLQIHRNPDNRELCKTEFLFVQLLL